MRPFWCSFWSTDAVDKSPGHFEYHGPWWESCYNAHGVGLCMAVMAEDEADAKRIVTGANKEGWRVSEWRFVQEKDPEWSPFNERFPRASWMRWPWPSSGGDEDEPEHG